MVVAHTGINVTKWWINWFKVLQPLLNMCVSAGTNNHKTLLALLTVDSSLVVYNESLCPERHILCCYYTLS